MKFFTEKWYMKFYGVPTFAYADNESLNDELFQSYRMAKSELLPAFMKMPGASRYKACDFHDAIVRKIEFLSGDLIFHMDTRFCHCSVDKLIFTKAELKSVPHDFLTKSDLDWFQSEESFQDGRYQIGILFRDDSRRLPCAESCVSSKEVVGADVCDTDFPAPYIMEFSAEEIIVEDSSPTTHRT